MNGFVLLSAAAHGGGWIGSWSPGIGDPTPAGWLATLAYFVAAWRRLPSAARAPRSGRRAARAPVRLAVVSFAALLGYVVVRAAPFHHIDIAISRQWLGLRLSPLVELAVLLVAAR